MSAWPTQRPRRAPRRAGRRLRRRPHRDPRDLRSQASTPADRSSLERDAALEVQSVAASVIAADGHPSDAELGAFADGARPRGSRPCAARRRRRCATAPRSVSTAAFPVTPSPVFETIVTADTRHGTTNGWRYYHGALRVAHAVCAIDTTPTREELLAVDTLRSTLLRRLHAAGIEPPADDAAIAGGAGDRHGREAGRHARIAARRAREAHGPRRREDRGAPPHQPRAGREPPP